MDGICGAVFGKIKALGAYGRYFVISAEEFLEDLPDGERANIAELDKALKSLASEGYIDIKYSGGSMYCVAALKNYEPQLPPVAVNADTYVKKSQNASLFWAAFAGGAAAGIATALICLLFLLC